MAFNLAKNMVSGKKDNSATDTSTTSVDSGTKLTYNAGDIAAKKTKEVMDYLADRIVNDEKYGKQFAIDNGFLNKDGSKLNEYESFKQAERTRMQKVDGIVSPDGEKGEGFRVSIDGKNIDIAKVEEGTEDNPMARLWEGVGNVVGEGGYGVVMGGVAGLAALGFGKQIAGGIKGVKDGIVDMKRNKEIKDGGVEGKNDNGKSQVFNPKSPTDVDEYLDNNKGAKSRVHFPSGLDPVEDIKPHNTGTANTATNPIKNPVSNDITSPSEIDSNIIPQEADASATKSSEAPKKTESSSQPSSSSQTASEYEKRAMNGWLDNKISQLDPENNKDKAQIERLEGLKGQDLRTLDEGIKNQIGFDKRTSEISIPKIASSMEMQENNLSKLQGCCN